MQRADGIDYETFLLLKMLDILSVFGGICFSLGMYYLKKKKNLQIFPEGKVGCQRTKSAKKQVSQFIFFQNENYVMHQVKAHIFLKVYTSIFFRWKLVAKIGFN